MIRHIAARLALIPVILFGVVTLLFVIFKTIPGDEAALMAGLAFSNTKTALAHSLSYDITLQHGVPHGLACSFSLPLVLAGTVESGGMRLPGVTITARNDASGRQIVTSTDADGSYTVCVKEDGDYYAVAWKAGYALSTETKVSLATGSLKALNPVISKGSGGRDLAIGTPERSTTAVGIEPGGEQGRARVGARTLGGGR